MQAEDLGMSGQFYSGEVFGVDPSFCVLECSLAAGGTEGKSDIVVKGESLSSSSSFSSSICSSMLRLVEALAKRLQGPMGGLLGEKEERDELDPPSSLSSEGGSDLEGHPFLFLVRGGKKKQ
uniref:Uncharacterized protein n=1 Tax=Chromera velia CCMP2878 TaxID=1169474 RepID=A0A0G4HBU5_9ALVE|eukprot:Cvel_26045.t1-p1 / transcript=Cvel_26045.t1 / gene=Cvel_26045 / organism=Chromera_velia_CCMP2878 / gene_product=hypothetical protein / transcript_product=hypothetical protein / location=Cvel_scaffold3036:8466-8828(-) / protein_length=121 / sequence_SO=supercontig / SO=protein_coding / is_pseudo=false